MILLDTHVVVWALSDPAKLSRAAIRAVSEAQQTGRACIADISLFELARLARKGAFAGPRVREMVLAAELRHQVMPITTDISMAAMELPSVFPKDPADRIIAATALVHRIPLVTADRAIQDSGVVPTIW